MSGNARILIDEFLSLLLSNLKGNLDAVIAVGSAITATYIAAWSDLDLLIAVKVLTLAEKRQIGLIKRSFEQKHKIRLGLNVVKTLDITENIYPIQTLDGKTLQCLHELSLFPERLVFQSDSSLLQKFYQPTLKDVKSYSHSNITMFKLRNRKSLLNADFDDPALLKEHLRTELRAALIMTKLLLQVTDLRTVVGREEIFAAARLRFSHLAVSALETAFEVVPSWSDLSDVTEIYKLFEIVDSYIETLAESISEYVTST